MQVLCHPGKLIGETKIGVNFVRRTGSLRLVLFCVVREIAVHFSGKVLFEMHKLALNKYEERIMRIPGVCAGSH